MDRPFIPESDFQVLLDGAPIEGVIDAVVDQRLEGQAYRSSARVSLTPDLDMLSHLDLTGVLRIQEHSEERIIFTGIVVDAELVGDRYELVCSDHSHFLTEHPAACMCGQPGVAIGILESVYYLLAFWDEAQAHAANILTDGGVRVQDRPPISEVRDHVVVFPAPFCTLPRGAVTIGSGRIYDAPQRPETRDDAILAVCAQKHPELLDTPLMSFRVRAKGLYDAIQRGKALYTRTCDYLVFASHIGTPCLPGGGHGRVIPYSRQRALVCPMHPAWSYARDMLRPSAFWLQFAVERRSSGRVDLHPDDSVLETIDVIPGRLNVPDYALSDASRRQLQALHSLRAARVAATPADAVVHIWNAIEFLVAGERPAPVFAREDLDAIRASMESTVASRTSDPEDLRERTKRIEAAMLRLNEAPLRTRWQTTCERVGAKLSVGDETTWAHLRKARNALQHGKPHTAEWPVVERGIALVSRVALRCLAMAPNEESEDLA